MMIIIGITTPWYQQEINEIGKYLTAVTHGLGDGLVTVESTRLKGISHKTVNGTHLTMIRNITESSQRIPPAVPLIVDLPKKNDNIQSYDDNELVKTCPLHPCSFDFILRKG